MALMKMNHEEDPAQLILTQVKDFVNSFDLFGAKVLLVPYIRPRQTASGIHLPDSTRDEEKYQGKSALVVKRGIMPPDAEDEQYFGGRMPDVGEWVLFQVNAGYPIEIPGTKGNITARVLHDIRNIIAKIQSPDTVW